MGGFKRGNSRTPALSPHLLDLFQEAWTSSSLQFGLGQVCSGALLLDHESLRGLVPSRIHYLKLYIPTEYRTFVHYVFILVNTVLSSMRCEMPRTIVFTGHGFWKPIDGYATVPRGSEIRFYTEHMKLLPDSMGQSIERGEKREPLQVAG